MLPEPDYNFSDEPIDGSVAAPDRLERSRFVATLARSINSLAGQRSSSVIGLVGPWGSGKTSIIKLVNSQLNQTAVGGRSHPWVVVEFNPWYFQDMASLQWGFLRALGDGVAPDKTRMRNVRDAISKYGMAIAPLGAVGGFAGFDLSKTIGAASELVSTQHSPDRQQSALEKLLMDGSKPVLIVLDDLDRLSPDELLLVFKLIRLVGRLPFVHYLIAYDEDTLHDVLRRTGLVGRDAHRASSYLEKMIQLRIDVPPLRQTQIEALVEDALNRMASSIGLGMDRQQQEKFASAYQMHLRHSLTTPRNLKRYVAQVEAFFPSVAEEVDSSDFLLLTWLRTAAPRLYAALPREKSTLTGNSGSVMESLQSHGKTPSDYEDHWTQIFENAHIAPEDLASVKGILGRIFPRYADISNRTSSFTSSRSTSRSVANQDYFDRYFAFEVPLEDISDLTIGAAYAAILTKSPNDELRRVEAGLKDRTTLVVSKLEAKYDATRDPEEASALLLWLARWYGVMPDPLDLFTPRRQVEGFCSRLYLQLFPRADILNAAIRSIADMSGGLTLAAVLIRAASTYHFFGAEADIRAREDAYPRAKIQFGQIIREKFEQYTECSPAEIPDEVWSLIWTWRVIDPAGAQRMFAAQFDSTQWRRLDVAARLVVSRTMLGVGETPSTISEYDLETADQLVGLTQLIEECRQMPEFTTEHRAKEGETATPKNCIGFILSIVDDLQAGRREFPPNTQSREAAQ